MRTSKLLAFWGGGAMLLASAGTVVVLSAAAAAPISSGTVTTTSAGNGNGKGGGNNGNGAGNGGSGATPPAKSLTVTHHVLGTLTLGQAATVRVTVTNPNSQAVVLTAVDGTVTDVHSLSDGTPACTTSMFSVTDWTGSTTIARNASTTADLTVHLVESGTNQDACKNATYDFSFTATAHQA